MFLLLRYHSTTQHNQQSHKIMKLEGANQEQSIKYIDYHYETSEKRRSRIRWRRYTQRS